MDSGWGMFDPFSETMSDAPATAMSIVQANSDSYSSAEGSPVSIDSAMFDALALEDVLPLPSGLSCFSNLASYGEAREQPSTFRPSFPWFPFGFSSSWEGSQSSAATEGGNRDGVPQPNDPAVPEGLAGAAKCAVDPAGQSAVPPSAVDQLISMPVAADGIPPSAGTAAPTVGANAAPYFPFAQVPQLTMPSFANMPNLPSFPQLSTTSMGTQLATASAKASAAGARIHEALSSTVKRAAQAMSLLPPIAKRAKPRTHAAQPAAKSSTAPENNGETASKPKPQPRRPRTREQLDKCRQESARARDRKRQERARLDALVSGKTEEAEMLRKQICTLEAELHYLRQYVVQNALTTLQSQPAARASQFAAHVVAYVTQLLQSGAAALRFSPPSSVCSPPLPMPSKIACTRQIRPRPVANRGGEESQPETK